MLGGKIITVTEIKNAFNWLINRLNQGWSLDVTQTKTHTHTQKEMEREAE